MDRRTRHLRRRHRRLQLRPGRGPTLTDFNGEDRPAARCRRRTRAIILIGPAGTGKTTVGQALADEIGARFFDADNAHTPEDVAKMRRGEGLTDADRTPWLERVRAWCVAALHAGAVVVVACSALRERYREQLAQHDPRFVFVYLEVPPELLARRLAQRRGHYAGPDLLSSQLATFERPHGAVIVDGRLTVRAQVDAIRASLQL